MRNEKEQPYGQMLILTAYLTVLGSVVLLPMAWTWGGEWDFFLKNNTPPFNAPLELLTFFRSYHSYLESSGLWRDFYVHLFLPTSLILGASAYLSKIILYAEGELDGKVHVSGPELLEAKRAGEVAPISWTVNQES